MLKKITQHLYTTLLLCFSTSFGNIYFSSPQSAVSLSGGSLYIQNTTGNWDGTLDIRSGSVSGSILNFSRGIYTTSQSEGYLTGQLDFSGSQKVFLNGSQRLRGAQGFFVPQTFVGGAGNVIEGAPIFLMPVTLNTNAAELQLNVQSKLNRNIILNGGTIKLLDDINLADDVTFSGSGLVNLNYRRINFPALTTTWNSNIVWTNPSDIVLNARTVLSSMWTLSGNAVLNGNGNILDLSSGGTLLIQNGASVQLTDVHIRGLGSTLGTLLFQSKTSELRLSNCTLEFSSNYTLTTGGIYVEGDKSVLITGTNSLTLNANASMTVDRVTLFADTLDATSTVNVSPNIPNVLNLIYRNNGIMRALGAGGTSGGDTALGLATSNAVAGLLVAVSNAVSVINTLNNANSSAIVAINTLNLANSSAIVFANSLAVFNSQAIRALSQGITNNSNAIVGWIKDTSNSVNGLLVHTSNAVAGLLVDTSNAVNNLRPLVVNTSNAVNGLLVSTSNAVAGLLVSVSNAVSANNTLLINTSHAVVSQNTLLQATSNALVALSNAVVASNSLAIDNSNAIIGWVKDTSNAINNLYPLVVNTSNAVNGLLVSTSNAVAGLLVSVSNAVSADHQITVGNSNAIVSWIAGTSQAVANFVLVNSQAIVTINNLNLANSYAIIAINTLNVANSYGVVALRELAVATSDALLANQALDIQTSNAVVTMNNALTSWVKDTSNAVAGLLVSVSNAVSVDHTLLVNTSNALVTLSNQLTSANGLATANSSAIVSWIAGTSNAVISLYSNVQEIITELQTIDHGPSAIHFNASTITMSYAHNISTDHVLYVHASGVIDGGTHAINFTTSTAPIFIVDAGMTVTVQNVVLNGFASDAVTLGNSAQLLLGEGTIVKLDRAVDIQQTWSFVGNAIIDGQGNVLNLGIPDAIIVDNGKAVQLQNVILDGLGSSSMYNMRILGPDGSLVFNNAHLMLDSEYRFTMGSLLFNHDTIISGSGRTFVYSSASTSTIAGDAVLTFDKGLTWSYDSVAAKKDRLYFASSTASLHLDSCTIHATHTGLHLSGGTLIIDDKVIFRNEAINEAEASILSASLSTYVLGGATLEVGNGIILYQ